MDVSAVILSFNRLGALERTLREVVSQRWAQRGEVIVVDNASTDGSPAMVREKFPGVRLIELPGTALSRASTSARAKRGPSACSSSMTIHTRKKPVLRPRWRTCAATRPAAA